MDFMTPLIFDVSNIDIWKLRMSAYLKTLGMHVYIAGNNKHIKANAQVQVH